MANPYLDQYRAQQTAVKPAAQPQQEGGPLGFIRNIVKGTVDSAVGGYQGIERVLKGQSKAGELGKNTDTSNALNKQRAAYIQSLTDADFDRPEVKKRLADLQGQADAVQGKAKTLRNSSELRDSQAVDATKTAANVADTVLTVGSLGLGGLAKNVAKTGIEGAIKATVPSTFKQAVGRGLGEGAVYGGAYGALNPLKEKGKDATFEDVAGGAVNGAGTGAILGGTVGGGLNVGSKVLNAGKAVKNFVAGNTPQTGVLNRVNNSLQDKAATSLLKLTPAQTQKLLDSGVDSTKLAQRAAQFGKSAEEIIGSTGKKGPLQDTIKSLESGMQTTIDRAGTNIKIDATDIIKGLEKEAKAVSKELGGAARSEQLKKVIADAKAKYKNGVTVKDAMKTLRTANDKFGKAVLDDSGDAIVTAAQKLEGNTLREALKSRFPSIAKGLDDQSELIQLREVLQRARATDKVGGFRTGKVDLTRPGTLLDPVLNSKTVSSGILKRGKNKEGVVPADLAEDIFGEPKTGVVQGGLNALQGTGILGNVLRQGEGRMAGTPGEVQPTEDLGTVEPSQEELDSYLQDEPAQNIFSEDNIKNLILQDMAGNEGKNVTQLLALYNAFGKAATPKPKTEAQVAREEAYGISQDALKSLAAGGVATGPLAGAIEDFKSMFNAGDPKSIEFNRQIGALRSAIVKARGGSAVTDTELKLIDEFVPKKGDSEQMIKSKLDYIAKTFGQATNLAPGSVDEANVINAGAL